MTETAAWKRRDAELYGELPPRYAGYVQRIGAHIVREIVRLARLTDGERVLDVGSGTGAATVAVARAVAPGGRAVGIDHSGGWVEAAAAAAPVGLGLDYRVMDAEDLAFEDAAFDAVVSFSAVFHFPDPERALREMARVLRPGGRLVLTYHAHRSPPGGEPGPGRELRAPEALLALADDHLPALEVAPVAEWSRAGAAAKLAAWLGAAGFAIDEETWVGRDVPWDDPDEFFEAQVMIHSELRARASAAGPQERLALRRALVGAAARVLRDGGRLVYPFGAVCLRALRSESRARPESHAP